MNCKHCGKPIVRRTWVLPKGYMNPELAGTYECSGCLGRHTPQEVAQADRKEVKDGNV